MSSGEMGGGVLMALAGLIPIVGLVGIVAVIAWAIRQETGPPDAAPGLAAEARSEVSQPAPAVASEDRRGVEEG